MGSSRGFECAASNVQASTPCVLIAGALGPVSLSLSLSLSPPRPCRLLGPGDAVSAAPCTCHNPPLALPASLRACLLPHTRIFCVRRFDSTTPAGSPQLAGSHSRAAAERLVLGRHVGVDPGLPAPIWVLPGTQPLYNEFNRQERF